MKTIKVLTLVLALFILLGGAGCSNQEAEEGGSADRITTEAAQKMTDHIRTPIDKAKATRSLGDDRVKEMDKALKNQ